MMQRRSFITLLGGAAATWPMAALAQKAGKIPTVGVLWHAGNPEGEQPYFDALIQGFGDLGYVDGRTIKLEHRFPDEAPDRFRTMAAELVSLNVDALVTVGSATAPYAKNATTTIPIVFTLVGDPLGTRLVDSLARPGGNVTGFSNFSVDLNGKRLQFLGDIIPNLSRIGLLVNPLEASSRLLLEETRNAAAKLAMTLQTFEARSLDDLEGAFDAMVKGGVQAANIGGGGLFFVGRANIAKLALARNLPIGVWSRETLEAGALMSYGADQVSIVRRAAVYVDKILKGARPAELPVQQPTKFQFLINLKTANALGITVPPVLLANADEVIE
jgi:putative ABC transport system substrate-binding protein